MRKMIMVSILAVTLVVSLGIAEATLPLDLFTKDGPMKGRILDAFNILVVEINTLGDRVTIVEASAQSTSTPVCPTENVQHWVQIAWAPTTTFTHDTLPTLLTSDAVTTNAQINPDTINDIELIIVTSLVDGGYKDSNDIPVLLTNRDFHFSANSVQYSIICAE